MPAMPPPVADERQALRNYLLQQQYAFRALAFGLTDDQARRHLPSAPCPSAR